MIKKRLLTITLLIYTLFAVSTPAFAAYHQYDLISFGVEGLSTGDSSVIKEKDIYGAKNNETQSSANTWIDTNKLGPLSGYFSKNPPTSDEILGNAPSSRNTGVLSYDEFMNLVEQMGLNKEKFERGNRFDENSPGFDMDKVRDILNFIDSIKDLHMLTDSEIQDFLNRNTLSIPEILEMMGYSPDAELKGLMPNEDGMIKALEAFMDSAGNGEDERFDFLLLLFNDTPSISSDQMNFICGQCGGYYSYNSPCLCGKKLYNRYLSDPDVILQTLFVENGGSGCSRCGSHYSDSKAWGWMVLETGEIVCSDCYYFNNGDPLKNTYDADFLFTLRVGNGSIRETIDLFHKCFPSKEYRLLDLLGDIAEMAPEIGNYDFDMGSWDESMTGHLKDAVDAYLDDLISRYNGGIPHEDFWDDDIKRMGDEVKDAADKIFSAWPENKDLWSDEMKEKYQEYIDQYKDDDTLKWMDENGILDSDKNAESLLEELRKMQNPYTSIEDTVNCEFIVTMEESVQESEKTNYNAPAYYSYQIITPSGRIIENTEWTGQVFTFRADEVGIYTVNRACYLVPVTNETVLLTAVAKWVADGEVIWQREIGKQVINRTGLKLENGAWGGGATTQYNVEEGSMGLFVKDDFTTEKVNPYKQKK